MARLTLKRRSRDEDEEDDKPTKTRASADTTEDFDDDDDSFFGEGLAEDWANKHKAPEQRFRPEFWISKEDDDRNRIIFADTKPAFTILMHSVYMGGNNYPKYTCVRSKRECPLCAANAENPKGNIGRSYSVFAWAVWQWYKWEDKDKNVHYVSPRYWMLPKPSTDTLLKTLAKHKSKATEMLFEVIKGSGKNAGFSLVGEELGSKKLAKLEEAGDHYSKDEFKKYYAPLSDDEMEGIIAASTRHGAAPSRGKGGKPAKKKKDDDDDDLD